MMKQDTLTLMMPDGLSLTRRTEGEAILVNNAISHPPFSAAALGELPQVLNPRSWQIPPEEVPERRDLRSDDYLICSVDPPGG